MEFVFGLLRWDLARRNLELTGSRFFLLEVQASMYTPSKIMEN